MTISLPSGFGYVAAALLSTSFVLQGQSLLVSSKRKAAGVAYPQMYATPDQEQADKKYLIFNCAQRAHQNTLENLPIVAVTTLVAGLKYPIPAAIVCAFWSVSRIFYTRGYVTGDPKKRVSAVYGLATVGLIGNLLTATYVAVGLVLHELGRV